MKIISTAIEGVMIVENRPFEDSRGRFSRLFCEDALSSVLSGRKIVQINHSLTRQIGTIRGLHYQHQPYAEMKMVRCLKGRVWDVVVDLRKDSSTFLQWYARELTEDRAQMMIIPEGCAHGFQVLESDAELLYLHTAAYTPDAEGGVRYDDPMLSIDWPLAVSDVSSRDQSYDLLLDVFQGLDHEL